MYVRTLWAGDTNWTIVLITYVRTLLTSTVFLLAGPVARSGGATWAVGLQIESGHERTLAEWPTCRLEPLCGVRLHAFLGVAELIEVAL